MTRWFVSRRCKEIVHVWTSNDECLCRHWKQWCIVPTPHMKHVSCYAFIFILLIEVWVPPATAFHRVEILYRFSGTHSRVGTPPLVSDRFLSYVYDFSD